MMRKCTYLFFKETFTDNDYLWRQKTVVIATLHACLVEMHNNVCSVVESNIWLRSVNFKMSFRCLQSKKSNTSQLLLPHYQSTYPRGQESASMEIFPFRCQIIKFSKTVLLSKSCFTMFTFRGTFTK